MAINLSIPTPSVSMLTLSGAKTYLVAAAAIAYAGYGFYTHQMNADEAAAFLLSGAGAGAVRAAIAKVAAFSSEHTDAIDSARAEIAQLRSLVSAVLAQSQATQAAVSKPPVSIPIPPAPTPPVMPS
jgi:hypothetical protein